MESIDKLRRMSRMFDTWHFDDGDVIEVYCTGQSDFDSVSVGDRIRRLLDEAEAEISERYMPQLRKEGGIMPHKLTAEQVRDAWCGNLKRDCLYDPPTPDWQAIADELNASLGHSLNNPSMSETLSERGTCEMKCDEFGTYYCSECGAYEIVGYRDDHAYACMPFYCPNCGRRVVTDDGE